MEFVAIDFETATSDRSSACAVGAVRVSSDLQVVGDPFEELIQPPGNEYDSFNTMIHGIRPDMTRDADTFDAVWKRLDRFIGGRLVVAHNTAFDMYVLRYAAATYGIEPDEFEFACTYRLARAAWPGLYSYRLDVLAERLNIELVHHVAAEDARAAALIAIAVCHAQGAPDLPQAAESLGFRLGRFTSAYLPFSDARGTRLSDLMPSGSVDADHPLYGARIAFTGTLQSMTRAAAAQLAVNAGAVAHSTVKRDTTYLVMGMTDFSKVIDGSSAKAKRAVELAAAGSGIEILDESEFLRLLGTA